MAAHTSKQKSLDVKVIGLVTVIVIALGAALFTYLRSGPAGGSSGEAQQMKGSSRSAKRPAPQPGSP